MEGMNLKNVTIIYWILYQRRNFKIVHTFFRKREDYYITYNSVEKKSEIDYIM